MQITPTHQPSLREIEGDTPRTKAERRLLAECRDGEVIFGAVRPDEVTDANSIRGPLLRFLLLGGEDGTERAGFHSLALDV